MTEAKRTQERKIDAYLEGIRIFLRELVEILAEEDVALLDVTEKKNKLCLVRRIIQRVLQDLVHWSAVCALRGYIRHKEDEVGGLGGASTHMPEPPATIPTWSNSFTAV
jgi:hypothetical protein